MAQLQKDQTRSGRPGRPRSSGARLYLLLLLLASAALLLPAGGCTSDLGSKVVRPLTLRDVPAGGLAYRFEADGAPPPGAAAAAAAAEEALFPAVQVDFDVNRKDDALLRTVLSPDGQRVLALYATADMAPGIFRLDMYAAEGKFLRTLTPPDMACAFLPSVTWSPDGLWIAFIARQNTAAAAAAPPSSPAGPEVSPEATPPGGGTTETVIPTPVGPLFPPVEMFETEQVYLCDRDGFNLKPLTTREGLIYFHVAWSPQGSGGGLAALACKEEEWRARGEENRPPAGRPRLLFMDGSERLLDDRLTDVLPVWSPDAAKVATAFETDVAIYDATLQPSTGARIQLREPLLEASVRYDAAQAQEAAAAQATAAPEPEKPKRAKARPTPTPEPTPTPAPDAVPLSFNPVVRLEWPRPETLFIETGFVRVYANEMVNNYLRWHVLHLSPQSVLLGARVKRFGSRAVT